MQVFFNRLGTCPDIPTGDTVQGHLCKFRHTLCCECLASPWASMKQHYEPLPLVSDDVVASLACVGNCRQSCCGGQLSGGDKGLNSVLHARGQYQLCKGFLVPVDWFDVADKKVNCESSLASMIIQDSSWTLTPLLLSQQKPVDPRRKQHCLDRCQTAITMDFLWPGVKGGSIPRCKVQSIEVGGSRVESAIGLVVNHASGVPRLCGLLEL